MLIIQIISLYSQYLKLIIELLNLIFYTIKSLIFNKKSFHYSNIKSS